MLRFPCLVLDHDDTVVKSEETVNFPYFQYILNEFRPGTTITRKAYTEGCFHLGFSDMCRQWYNFTEQELVDEYMGWKGYIMEHAPDAYPGIREIILRQKALGGKVFVVSHSSEMNISRDYNLHFGIQPDEIFGWDYPEHQRKPNAYPLERIMQKYGFKPEQMLVVDDMKPAWEMARKVGANVAFAGWGRTDYPELIETMTALCDYAFMSTEALENFLFGSLTDVL